MMKALILSGGTGSRLRPLTYTNAKQLIPVANKPALFYIIEKVVNANISDIGIIVGSTHKEVQSSVGDGSRWNARISYIHQKEPLGLAHAVKTAADFIGDSDFIMLLGDNLFDMGLGSFIDGFYASGSNASVLLHRMDNPAGFGVAVVENNHIVRLVEKPPEPISNLIITGIYAFDKTIFDAIAKTAPSKRGELEITDAMQVMLDMGGSICYEITKGWWKDTGKLPDLLEANQLMLDGLESSTYINRNNDCLCTGKIIADSSVLITDSIIRGPVAIGSNSIIKGSYIGPYASIGSSVKVDGCEVENSIIMEGSKLRNIGKRVSGSLIGKNTVVKGTSQRPDSICFLIGDNSEIYIQSGSRGNFAEGI
ncbi:glucose-1-phosphate thymidylyltransferase [Anaerobacterium chartisolvens]|nr:glucose-1-phosphate thymidylyltransferase [Anaerobacterium chartisolvens]